MKICPQCQTQYDDDTLATCEQDGAPLLEVPALPLNTLNPQIEPALPDADTADFDLDAVRSQLIKKADAPKKVTAPKKGPKSNPFNRRALLLALGGLVFAVLLFGIYLLFFAQPKVEIELNSDPAGAMVLLDGAEVGFAPVKVKVHAGTHQVIFRQKGFDDTHQTVQVAPDGTVTTTSPSP